MRFEALLVDAVAQLKAQHLFREPDDGAARAATAAHAGAQGMPLLDASSNDYLGFGGVHVSRETAASGAGASRLVQGTAPEHLRLELALADWTGFESALLFSSTYAANLGLISALGIEGAVVFSDAANHASLIDGCRLARANTHVVPHLDLARLEAALAESRRAAACIVVSEAYFSMDGDGPNLTALRALCDSEDACLVVDEAHSLGVFGLQGAGRCAEHGIKPDVLIGALGKSVGTHGGFVASSPLVRAYLWNRARSFVFSTALSPSHCVVTEHQVRSVRQADDRRAALTENASRLRQSLSERGLELIPESFGPIISVLVRDNERALRAADRLRRSGILAQAIRPPTVAQGSARIRLTVKATFSGADIQRLAVATESACA
ncbi:MAG TPA: 8-amino-7-oxononanoate synthase [Polyangiaceae bacterium]